MLNLILLLVFFGTDCTHSPPLITSTYTNKEQNKPVERGDGVEDRVTVGLGAALSRCPSDAEVQPKVLHDVLALGALAVYWRSRYRRRLVESIYASVCAVK